MQKWTLDDIIRGTNFIVLEGGGYMLHRVMHYATALVFGVSGYALAISLMPILVDLFDVTKFSFGVLDSTATELVVAVISGIFWLIVGFIVAPFLLSWGMGLAKTWEGLLSRFSAVDLLFGTAGLAFGLIIANLIGFAFHSIPIVGPYVPVVLSALLGYLGAHLMVRKRTDLQGYLGQLHLLPRHDGKKSKANTDIVGPESEDLEQNLEKAKLLDTSVVIDGRIEEISRTGFLEGPLVAPMFVLEELQKIADSSDSLKRARGRRGLDILQAMQDSDDVDLVVVNTDYEDIPEVDSKLMKLALERNWKLITNDFNLNKIASLQGISVLNLNDLANALKPTLISGESFYVQIVKAGKENGQGIAYLEDGTMIVVEQGMKYMNETIHVVVTSVLQTSAGRMIFAKPEEVK